MAAGCKQRHQQAIDGKVNAGIKDRDFFAGRRPEKDLEICVCQRGEGGLTNPMISWAVAVVDFAMVRMEFR